MSLKRSIYDKVDIGNREKTEEKILRNVFSYEKDIRKMAPLDKGRCEECPVKSKKETNRHIEEVYTEETEKWKIDNYEKSGKEHHDEKGN